MAAAATDLFRKLSRRWVGQIGSGGVADASVTTVPLSSATNLATDTGVTVVIDRVDANGANTPSIEETVVGVVSGSNLVSCVRGVEGTAQAHSAGAVVEVLVTADGYNDMVDGIVVEHNQDGTHKETALDSMITGTEAQGDIIYHNGTIWTRLPKGTDGQLLTQASNVPSWADGVTATSTTTFTNKRITKRITSITSHATPTINTDDCDAVTITAQAEAITSMTTNLSGTPTNFQSLIIRIKDNGTARAITWGASFEAKGTALPTTTVISKVLTVGFIYDTVTSKWGCVASAQEA